MSFLRAIFPGVGSKSLAIFYRQLGTLIGSGIDLLRSLASLESQTKNRVLRKVIKKIHEDISEGTPLCEALRGYPHLFSELQLTMVRSGEISGRLDENIINLANYLERAYGRKRRLITGLIYPILLFHCGILLPTLPILIKDGAHLYFQRTFGVLIPIYCLGFGIYILHRIIPRFGPFHNVWDNLILKFPIFGKIIKRFALARFAWSLECLQSAGADVGESLRIAADASGNARVRRDILNIIPQVKEGRKISQSLSASRLFPPMVITMLATGEESGKIEEMLSKISEYYELENEEAIKRLITIIPVVVYLLVAAFIAYIVITSYLGYFSGITAIP